LSFNNNNNNIIDLVQGKVLKFMTEQRWGKEIWRFSTDKSPYLRNGERYSQGYYWSLIGSRISPFKRQENYRPFYISTLNGDCALCFTNHASVGAHHENSKEDTPILSPAKM